MSHPNQFNTPNEQELCLQRAALWNNKDEVARFSEEDFLYCMNSLYKLRRYQDCLDVYKACKKKYPEYDKLDNTLGWSLYQIKLKNFDFQHDDIPSLFKQIDYVFDHSSNDTYSPRWFFARFVAGAVKDGKLPGKDYAFADRYLNKVDPDKLSILENTTTDKNGKKLHLASHRESWFSYKTYFLLQLEDYEACIACCDRAFSSLTNTRFHSNNDSWFRYRKAKCLQALGRVDEAKRCIEQILKSGFSHWCLHQMMFEFEAEAGNNEKALSYAGACALSDPEHKMRVSFYEELASYLNSNSETEIAMLLRKLVLLLYTENDWNTKNHQAEWQLSDEVTSMDKQEVLNRLTAIWRNWRDKDKVFMTGTISKLLAEGKSGFIAADNGNSYYFNARDLHGKTHMPEIGMKVRFTIVDKLDKSKGIVKPNAVEITVL